jgi:hypothetical protein
MPNLAHDILDALKTVSDGLDYKSIILGYLKEQIPDAKLYVKLARQAGWNKDAKNPAVIVDLVAKALAWCLQHGTPTIEAVRADLKLK